MTAIIFLCPNTGYDVQHWFDGGDNTSDNTYDSVTCLACYQVHLVNPKTGKVLGAGDKDIKLIT